MIEQEMMINCVKSRIWLLTFSDSSGFLFVFCPFPALALQKAALWYVLHWGSEWHGRSAPWIWPIPGEICDRGGGGSMARLVGYSRRRDPRHGRHCTICTCWKGASKGFKKRGGIKDAVASRLSEVSSWGREECIAGKLLRGIALWGRKDSCWCSTYFRVPWVLSRLCGGFMSATWRNPAVETWTLTELGHFRLRSWSCSAWRTHNFPSDSGDLPSDALWASTCPCRDIRWTAGSWWIIWIHRRQAMRCWQRFVDCRWVPHGPRAKDLWTSLKFAEQLPETGGSHCDPSEGKWGEQRSRRERWRRCALATAGKVCLSRNFCKLSSGVFGTGALCRSISASCGWMAQDLQEATTSPCSMPVRR